MALLDLTILILLGTALVFSIIELGLSAYAVNVTSDFFVEANSRWSYIVFASLWTILVTIFYIVWPFFSRRNDRERVMAPLTLALNFITMIFWVAGFGAVADMYHGAPGGTAGAILAFGVMLWYVADSSQNKTAPQVNLFRSTQAHLLGPSDPQHPGGGRGVEERQDGPFETD